MNTLIIRLFQFVVSLFFAFVVAAWFGGGALIFLACWVALTNMIGGHEASTFAIFISPFLSLLIVGGIIYYLGRVPKLGPALLNTGVGLFRLAKTTINDLEPTAK